MECENSFAESARAWVGIKARDDFFLGDIGKFDQGVKNVVSSFTPTGFLWSNIMLEVASAFKPDKTPYQG